MRNFFLCFLFFSLFLAACKKFSETPKKQCSLPYVDFIAQQVNTSTLEVTFTAVSPFNGTSNSYKWDFGDGTTYSGQNPPPHKYPPPSTPAGSSKYRIKLTVSNNCGEAFWTKEVTIAGCLPQTKFTYSLVNDSTVQFTNQTTGATNFVWNFGDGATSTANDKTITHIYKQDQSFTVALKASNDCGENNYTGTISICRKSVASQTINTTNCGSLNIDASASKNASKYQWNFGNGVILPATPSSTPAISYTYPNSGTYTIKLTVYNSSGCDSASTTNNVTVTASSLGANNNWLYTSDDLDFIFSRATVTNATSYKWNFGDGTSSTLQNPNHTYNNPGSYTLTLTAANSCGSAYEFTATINVPYYKALNNLPNTGFKQVIAVSPALIYYLGTNGKLYKTDTSGNWSSVNLPHGISFNNDTKIYHDPNNNLWIYGRREVAKLNSNGSWTSYFSTTGFGNNVTIRSMAVDNNNVLWTIGDNRLHKGNAAINSNISFSSLAYSPGGRIWLTSSNNSGLFYVNTYSNQINGIPNLITGGSDNIKISPTSDIYITTSSGILRLSSTGTLLNVFNSGNTGGMIKGIPNDFDFDTQGNVWILLSGQLFKLPVNNSVATKKYSFNGDLNNLSSISVLNLSATDSDILLAKTSGNAAIKIR